MFTWENDNISRILEIADKNKSIVDFTVEEIWGRGIQGECLTYRKERFTSIPYLKRKFPNLIFCKIGTTGNIENPNIECDEGIIVSPKNLAGERLNAALFYDWPNGGGVCLSINTLTSHRIPVTILENDPEVFAFKQKHKIASLEYAIKQAEDFLKNPWDEYERKKKDFEQKLEKAKNATEFKIAGTSSKLEFYKELLKDAQEEMINFLKGGYHDKQ